MALEVFKCENCGARVPPPPATVKMVVCEFCGNPGLNPFYVAPAPVAHAAPVAHVTHAAPVAQAPIAPAAPPRPRTAEEILRLAQTHLQLFDSLFYAPAIPAKKEQGAREGYGARIPADEPILALYDSTVFGGADDGFVITPRRLGWKNIALDPHTVTWDVFDARTVHVADGEVKVMGDMIQLGDDSALQGRMVRFLQAMGAVAQPGPAAAAPVPGPKTARPATPAHEADEGDDEVDAETLQSWIDDTHEMAEACFTRSAALYVMPNIPKDKVRAAFETYADDLEEDDAVVVLYDPPGGGSDDGFIATPWGLFWKNRGEDPTAVWWDDLDLDDVELDDGTLTIEGYTVRIHSQHPDLADELAEFIEAMVSWAQD